MKLIPHRNKITKSGFRGFICINSYCPRKNNKGIKQYNLRVGVINTNRNLLVWIKNNFGGAISSHGKPQSSKHKQCWSWVIEAKKAETFLKMICQYLKIKNIQAEIAFNFRNTFKLSKYIRYENGIHVGNKIPSELWGERMKLREQLKVVNQRGQNVN